MAIHDNYPVNEEDGKTLAENIDGSGTVCCEDCTVPGCGSYDKVLKDLCVEHDVRDDAGNLVVPYAYTLCLDTDSGGCGCAEAQARDELRAATAQRCY